MPRVKPSSPRGKQKTTTADRGQADGKDGQTEQGQKKTAFRILTTKEIPVEAALAVLPPLKYKDEKFYIYDDKIGCYHKISENGIGHLMQGCFPDASVPLINTCIQRIKRGV
jgi:hypothetical protein